jgi:hypothetical protein
MRIEIGIIKKGKSNNTAKRLTNQSNVYFKKIFIDKPFVLKLNLSKFKLHINNTFYFGK